VENQPQRKKSSQSRTPIAWRMNSQGEFPVRLENGIACQFQRGVPGLWNKTLFSVISVRSVRLHVF
jgi:hypothetical protein